MTIDFGDGTVVHVHLWWAIVAGCLWSFAAGFGGALAKDVIGWARRRRRERWFRRAFRRDARNSRPTVLP